MHEPAPSDEPAVTCRSLQPEDYPTVKEILSEAFYQAVHGNPGVLDSLQEEPWYDPAHLLVAEVDGQIVSHMGVRDGLLSCSGVGVPAGLVGAVCTAAAVRSRGIGAQLMRASFDHMRHGGLALSYLHTSAERAGFYSRLGYRRAVIENPRLTLRLADMGREDPPQADPWTGMRAAAMADAEALHRIYELQYGGQVSGSWSRTMTFWECRLRQQPKLFAPPRPMTFHVAGPGLPVAYVALLEAADSVTIGEWGCLPGAEEDAFGLLTSMLRHWRDRGIETAHLTISSCHPLRPLLEPFAADDQTGHSEIWVRVQNRELFLEKVRPLLEARATAAGFRCEIRLPEDGSVLSFGRGEPFQAEINVGDLCALIYNGRRLPGLLEEGTISVSVGDRAALDALFPDTGAARCAQDVY
jgi:predicted N-acetyltransferase YhbS